MTPAQFIDNPGWADFIPEMTSAARQRHLPAHEDCSRIDVEAVRSHLRRGGTLGAMPGYEERPGQIDMTGAIAAAFNAREHLMVEAGTGVGKSLAYLVPAILWAWTNDTPVIVSTATRNLQSQLIGSDIPRALGVVGPHAADFRVALLKGRANYLCLRAVGEFFAPGFWTMSSDEQALMPAFIDWLLRTPDGDLDSYDGLPRALLSCPGDECGGRRCPYWSRCFVYKARKAAAEAHLVIVNHALVLIEAASPGSGILPAYGRIVMDEAHNLESIATECLSSELSMPALTHILNRLVRRGRGKRARASGVLASVERQFQKGAFAGSDAAGDVAKALGAASRLVVSIVNAAEEFFDVAALLLRPADGRGVCRYRVVASPDGQAAVREFSLHGLFKPYEVDAWDEPRFRQAQARLEAQLAAMVNLLHSLGGTLDAAVPDGELNYLGDLSAQIGGVAQSIVDFANEANFVIEGAKDTHAYWVERVHAERRPSFVRLVAAPLSVADDLRRMFYAAKDSVVLCSATLRVGADFAYMARRLGCSERFRMLTATSPFDYFRQALVLAPDCLPDPSANPPGYAASLAALLRDLFAVTRGRALVLFTSYEMMNAVAAHARPELEGGGMRLLVQGEGMSRESMTAELLRSAGGECGDAPVVVFGAQSFWEGVDVAGEALSCVVMARLPFAQVGDPIVEARSEMIDRSGGSSFRDYALPEAVVKFRQGFGRLIRTKSDRGVVVISDPRIVTKNYGSTFRKSIPATVRTVSACDELLSRVAEFFSA